MKLLKCHFFFEIAHLTRIALLKLQLKCERIVTSFPFPPCPGSALVTILQQRVYLKICSNRIIMCIQGLKVKPLPHVLPLLTMCIEKVAHNSLAM